MRPEPATGRLRQALLGQEPSITNGCFQLPSESIIDMDLPKPDRLADDPP